MTLPRPELPEWGQRLMDKLDAKPRTGDSVNPNFSVKLTQAWMPLLIEAARRRQGMSISAYARRAIMSRVIADLGLDWDDVMDDEPAITADGDFMRRYYGKGFGDWRL